MFSEYYSDFGLVYWGAYLGSGCLLSEYRAIIPSALLGRLIKTSSQLICLPDALETRKIEIATLDECIKFTWPFNSLMMENSDSLQEIANNSEIISYKICGEKWG